MKLLLYWIVLIFGRIESYNLELLDKVELHSVDLCQYLTNELVHSYPEIVGCFNSIKLNPYRRNRTLEIIRKILPFYIFNDLAQHPPSNFAPDWKVPAVNLEQTLYLMEITDFKTEFEFHQELSKLIRQPLDGHLAYIPICFASVRFFLPIGLQANYLENEIEFYTVPATMYDGAIINKAQSIMGVNLTEYFGAKVIAIEGIEPVKALDDMSRSLVGVAKDPSSRLNNMMTDPLIVEGSPNVMWGSFAAPPNLPDKANVSITLETSKRSRITLNLPYLTYGSVNFKNGKEYFSSRCLQKDTVKAASDKDELNINDLLTTPLHGYLPESIINPIFQSSLVSAFGLDDGVTGVVSYPTNTASTVDELNEFLLTFHVAMLRLQSSGFTKLIIDVSHNTGGPICASLALLEYFLDTSPVYTTNLRYHPLSSELATRAAGSDPSYRIWGPLSWLNNERNSEIKDSSWLIPPVEISEGPRQGQKFSHLISDRCPSNPLRQKPHLFKPRDIAVLSNGICLSSCTTLVDGLIKANIPIHITDGTLPTTQSYYSRPSPHNMQGGQLYTYDKLYEDLEHFNLTQHPLAPPGPLPVRAVLGFTLRQMYPQSSNSNPKYLPMEYSHPTFNLTRHFYRNSDPFHIRKVDYFWNQVAKTM